MNSLGNRQAVIGLGCSTAGHRLAVLAVRTADEFVLPMSFSADEFQRGDNLPCVENIPVAGNIDDQSTHLLCFIVGNVLPKVGYCDGNGHQDNAKP